MMSEKQNKSRPIVTVHIGGRNYDRIVTLTRFDGSPLQAGDIQAGQCIEFDAKTGITSIAPKVG